MEYVWPDYTNCGLNVAAAVLHYFGVPCSHPGQGTVERLLTEKSYRNVVVMLFDGMAMSTLEEHLPADSFLRTHIAERMTAVFPPTTVAATTTIESGLSPSEHAWLGWSLYFAEMDRIVDVFADADTLTGERLGPGKSIARRYLPYHTLCEQVRAAGSAEAHVVSRYGDTRIQTLEELFSVTVALCNSSGRHYVYTYWAEPDSTMHEKGVMCAGDVMRDLDAKMAAFCRDIGEDTLVLATADHGLIDVEYAFISDYPELVNACERSYHIEARAAAFYVKPAFRADFPRIFAQTVGQEGFLILPAEEAVRTQLFGPGKEQPAFRGMLGDYLVVAVGRRCLARERTQDLLVAAHAGMTAREMYVPLIVGKK